MNKKVLRSVGSVVAGMVAITALSVGTDSLLEATGVFPSAAAQQEYGFTTPWMVLLAFAYRTCFDVVGGYLTAALAPGRPIQHALVLGSIGTIAGIAGAAMMWELAPAWYSLGLVVVGLPAVWLGAWMRTRRPKRTAPTAA